eukprot:257525-Heterocapsa_arctica.AAC.1
MWADSPAQAFAARDLVAGAGGPAAIVARTPISYLGEGRPDTILCNVVSLGNREGVDGPMVGTVRSITAFLHQ